MNNKRTVIKVGTSTLTYENGKINYRRIEARATLIILVLIFVYLIINFS